MKKLLQPLQKEYKNFDAAREILIRNSRDILKQSKQAIYAVHRGELKHAASLLAQAQKIKKKLDAHVKRKPMLLTVGAYADALEEFVEAGLFLAYIQGKPLPTAKKLGVDVDIYLRGLCDCTGELGRKAVNHVIKGKPEEALHAKEFVEEVYRELMYFDFRNSSLRQKFDKMKYTVERLEQLALKVVLR